MTLQEFYKQFADNIRARAVGGTLFGAPIDVDDPYAIVCAAYHMGIQDELSKRIDGDAVEKIFSPGQIMRQRSDED